MYHHHHHQCPPPPAPTVVVDQQFPTDLSLKSHVPSAYPSHQQHVTSSSPPMTSRPPSPSGHRPHGNVRDIAGRWMTLPSRLLYGSGGDREEDRKEEEVRKEEGQSGKQEPPRKRPSDFSTAFLLSHHPAPKRPPPLSPCPGSLSPLCPSSIHLLPPYSFAASPTFIHGAEEGNRFQDRSQENDKPPDDLRSQLLLSVGRDAEDRRYTSASELTLGFPSPSKILEPCLSASPCLEHQPSSPMLASAYYMSRNREDRVSTSSSVDPPSPGMHHERCFPSPLGLGREEGPSAFRRNFAKMIKDFTWTKKPSIEAKTPSPPTLSVDGAQGGVSPQERRELVASPRDSVFASPHDLTSPVLHPRRGSSTSPAHSERTSSGCGSPAEGSEGSPSSQQSRYQGDLSWGQTSSPFLPHSMSSQPQHPLFPVELRYFPGMPGMTKPLHDTPLSLGYPKYPKPLSDGLDSAFRSPHPPFPHPAAAAYYSSLRGSMPYPFSFPPSDIEGIGKASPGNEGFQNGAERVGMLRDLRKGAAEPLSAFQASPPSLQPSHRPPANGVVLSPRPSPRGSSLQGGGVAGRPLDFKDLPRVMNIPTSAAMAVQDIRTQKPRGAKDREPVRYQCEACSKSYSTFSGLSKHKQFHCAAQLKKEFSCKHCDKTYVSLGALKMHIRTHTLPCKCTVCGKAFSRPWLLQGHLRTHTGEKPFSCTHCARAFADRSNLRAHLQTHSDVKKYSCRHCSKTFSRMSLLLKHEDGCCNNNNAL